MSSSRNEFSMALRMQYERLNAKLAPKGVIPTYGYLRQDVELVNNQSLYEFNFQANNNNKAKTLPERFLALADGFFAIGMGVFLLAEVTAEKGGQLLQTYPNKTVFPAAAGFNPDDLRVIYNGEIETGVNNTTLHRCILTKQFLSIPTTQQGEVSAAITGPVIYPLDYSGGNFSDGFTELYPYWKLSGDASNFAKLSIPSWAGIEIGAVAAGVTHKVAMVLLGFDIPNGAKSMNQIDW